MPLRDHTLQGRLEAARVHWLAAAGVALMLSGCGASHISASASRRAASSRATAASGRNGSCRTVKAPEPRGPQHIAKPTGALDPSKTYEVRLQTNCGTITIKLAVALAPRITASFAHLVEIGFYNDLTFHRVVPGFVIQGGDPNGDGSGGPGYTVVERPPHDLHYTRGTVAMAKAASDPAGAAGSQFFIVTGAHVDLPPVYALLGRVVGGWQTVMAISHVHTGPGPTGEESRPATPMVISKATLTAGA